MFSMVPNVPHGHINKKKTMFMHRDSDIPSAQSVLWYILCKVKKNNIL
jgi:hypothetical protein